MPYLTEPLAQLDPSLKGLTLIQINPKIAVDLRSESPDENYLFERRDEQWVKTRPTSEDERRIISEQLSEMAIFDAQTPSPQRQAASSFDLANYPHPIFSFFEPIEKKLVQLTAKDLSQHLSVLPEELENTLQTIEAQQGFVSFYKHAELKSNVHVKASQFLQQARSVGLFKKNDGMDTLIQLDRYRQQIAINSPTASVKSKLHSS